MASGIAEEIESQFATLSPQIQLTILERLIHRMKENLVVDQDDEAFAREMAAMAADPAIQREIKEIDQEFRCTESDGLRNL